MRKSNYVDENTFMSKVDDILIVARNAIFSKRYEISEHVVRFLTGEGVNIQEIEDAIIKGKIIEIRSNPLRGKSFLSVGGCGEKAIHVIFTETRAGIFLIVMAYYPSPLIWKDSENRLSRGENSVNDAHKKCFFCGEEIKSITVGNFDYRLEGQLYVIKDVPAGLCEGCGEKYVSVETAKRIGELITQGENVGRESVLVFKFG